MELVNEFRVPVSAATAWEVLTDVQRVAPCIPGAQLLSVDGDDFTGAVKVKVGPITVSYQGEASFTEKDEAAQRVVIRASGKETRGSGNASALVTAQLKDEGSESNPATAVLITTDLTISGKAAQFGRGVLADVAGNLIAQFAARLEADVLGGAATPTSAPSAEAQTAAAAAADNSVDLVKVVALPIAKRYAPVAAGVAVGVAVGFLIGRRRRPQPQPALDDLVAALSRLMS
ncbi:SRPBCC family protein [Mycobacterium sp. SMC-4]|uniref:SRPBCC family protein n=1 Tax=Mycobacterium sp. SMC-4 TaxID=2857059 RepID=UPI0021B2EA0A|nr:SRPBCC family protein [Mycobacterium sp. SMC-4]UXA17469.1 SRPBCC family protein [Mycobacterium sp. SMC-4]